MQNYCVLKFDDIIKLRRNRSFILFLFSLFFLKEINRCSLKIYEYTFGVIEKEKIYVYTYLKNKKTIF